MIVVGKFKFPGNPGTNKIACPGLIIRYQIEDEISYFHLS